MYQSEVQIVDKQGVLSSKMQDYAQLAKLRLTSLVVFSAAMGFLMGNTGPVNWLTFTMLILGGLLVTGASNAFNQVLEKETDKLMDRTADRPLPDNRLSLQQATVAAFIMGVLGVAVLYVFVNTLSAILGALAMALYALAYTPMKKRSPFAVFIGAIPGAMPPMLGWVAATGFIGFEAWALFVIQFMWQFPHFWAIAWVLDDDYRKAGFKMLPSTEGRTRSSAFQILVYTFCMIPAGLIPWYFGLSGGISAIFITLCAIGMLIYAIRLFKECSLEAARKLMFGSFIYLPLVQIALVLDNI